VNNEGALRIAAPALEVDVGATASEEEALTIEAPASKSTSTHHGSARAQPRSKKPR
jgi:hypothetical protein